MPALLAAARRRTRLSFLAKWRGLALPHAIADRGAEF